MRGRRKRRYEYRRYRLGYYQERQRRKKRRAVIIASCAAAAVLAALLSGWFLLSRREGGQEGNPAGGDFSLAAGAETGAFPGERPGEPTPSPEPTAPPRERVEVRGIYVTGMMAGSDQLDALLDLTDETELNTMVIDVKDDGGRVTFETQLECVCQIEAQTRYIRDIDALMARLKEHGVYTIARIVCFKDPWLAEKRPELALKTPEGTPVTDANGLAWVNPCREEVWDYLSQIACEAAARGFDEIQFDYVRFPIGEVADAADYGVELTGSVRQQTITDFLTYAKERVEPTGAAVTADVFGTIIGSETDKERTGQDYAGLGGIIDVLCPMVYPSHYGNGVFGLEVPDAQPYETVYAALTGSKEELADIDPQIRARVRPWLQAFTASWVEGHISYGGEQIRQQIQAVYDAGCREWILWNASNRYSADGLLPQE